MEQAISSYRGVTKEAWNSLLTGAAGSTDTSLEKNLNINYNSR